MINELLNETTLIRRCQKGDLSAFELIYRHYEKPMYSFALRMHNHDDACEAIQISFIKVYQNMSKFRFQSKFSTYIFKILINACYDVRKKKRTESLDVLQNMNTNNQNHGYELKILLEEAIINLPDRMRECFVLFGIQGFKQDEIAEMLSITIGAVKTHIFKAKQKLKILLADQV